MSRFALQAWICKYIHENLDIRYFFDLKRRLKNLNRFDMLDILENDLDFSLKVKEFLFNRRMGGVSFE